MSKLFPSLSGFLDLFSVGFYHLFQLDEEFQREGPRDSADQHRVKVMSQPASVCLDDVFSTRQAEALLRNVLSYQKERLPCLTRGDCGGKSRNQHETSHQGLDVAPSFLSAEF